METEFVLFDFDGVIANTEESNAAYLEKALSAFGIQLTDDDRKALIGTNDKTRIESLLSRSLVKVTAEDLAGKRRQVGNTYENSCIRPMPGGGIPDSGDTGPGNKDRTGDLYLHPADYDCTEPDEDDRAV